MIAENAGFINIVCLLVLFLGTWFVRSRWKLYLGTSGFLLFFNFVRNEDLVSVFSPALIILALAFYFLGMLSSRTGLFTGWLIKVFEGADNGAGLVRRLFLFGFVTGALFGDAVSIIVTFPLLSLALDANGMERKFYLEVFYVSALTGGLFLPTGSFSNMAVWLYSGLAFGNHFFKLILPLSVSVILLFLSFSLRRGKGIIFDEKIAESGAGDREARVEGSSTALIREREMSQQPVFRKDTAIVEPIRAQLYVAILFSAILSLVFAPFFKMEPAFIGTGILAFVLLTSGLSLKELFNSFEMEYLISMVFFFPMAAALKSAGTFEVVENMLVTLGERSEFLMAFLLLLFSFIFSLLFGRLESSIILGSITSGIARGASISNFTVPAIAMGGMIASLLIFPLDMPGGLKVEYLTNKRIREYVIERLPVTLPLALGQLLLTAGYFMLLTITS